MATPILLSGGRLWLYTRGGKFASLFDHINDFTVEDGNQVETVAQVLGRSFPVKVVTGSDRTLELSGVLWGDEYAAATLAAAVKANDTRVTWVLGSPASGRIVAVGQGYIDRQGLARSEGAAFSLNLMVAGTSYSEVDVNALGGARLIDGKDSRLSSWTNLSGMSTAPRGVVGIIVVDKTRQPTSDLRGLEWLLRSGNSNQNYILEAFQVNNRVLNQVMIGYFKRGLALYGGASNTRYRVNYSGNAVDVDIYVGAFV